MPEEPSPDEFLKWLRIQICEAARDARYEAMRSVVIHEVECARSPGWYEADCFDCDWSTSGREKVVEEAAKEHVVELHVHEAYARCHAEISLLDRHAELDRKRDNPWPADPAHVTTQYLAIGEAVQLIAQGYRHRPGWQEEWAA